MNRANICKRSIEWRNLIFSCKFNALAEWIRLNIEMWPTIIPEICKTTNNWYALQYEYSFCWSCFDIYYWLCAFAADRFQSKMKLERVVLFFTVWLVFTMLAAVVFHSSIIIWLLVQVKNVCVSCTTFRWIAVSRGVHLRNAAQYNGFNMLSCTQALKLFSPCGSVRMLRF